MECQEHPWASNSPKSVLSSQRACSWLNGFNLPWALALLRWERAEAAGAIEDCRCMHMLLTCHSAARFAQALCGTFCLMRVWASELVWSSRLKGLCCSSNRAIISPADLLIKLPGVLTGLAPLPVCVCLADEPPKRSFYIQSLPLPVHSLLIVWQGGQSQHLEGLMLRRQVAAKRALSHKLQRGLLTLMHRCLHPELGVLLQGRLLG